MVLEGGDLFIIGVSRPVTTEFCRRLQEKPFVPWGEASLSLGWDIDGTILYVFGRNNKPLTSIIHEPHRSSIHPFVPLSTTPSIHPPIHLFYCSLISTHFMVSHSIIIPSVHPSSISYIHPSSCIPTYPYFNHNKSSTHLSYHLSIIFSPIHPSILHPFT